jgi:hypothetical protein
MISEMDDIGVYDINISDIIIPFSTIIKRDENQLKYENLSSIPVEKQRKDYLILLRQELS